MMLYDAWKRSYNERMRAIRAKMDDNERRMQAQRARVDEYKAALRAEGWTEAEMREVFGR